MIILSPNGGHSDGMPACGRMMRGQDPENWPWRAVVANHEGDKCLAILISKTHVITGKDCGSGAHDGQVYVGKRSNESEPLEVASVHCSPHGHNVCLLELSEPVNFTESVSPICLPAEGSTFKDRMDSFIIGSPVEEKEEVPYVGYSRCKCYHHDLSEGTICAGRGMRHGMMERCKHDDSAGVLMIVKNETWILIGVSSSDQNCDDSEGPKLFSGLSKYQEWIEKATDIGEQSFVEGEAPEEEEEDFECPTPEPTHPPPECPHYPSCPPPECRKPNWCPHPPRCPYAAPEDCRDESVFGSGVSMMPSSPFILLCVLALSLYSTNW
ncbi:chymotrypsin-like protease CTRL-1 [Notolabrus celidotus]|uniref:chymotrypsin-like protease CTRL-1 n=1 Tax=Notolabrus celidotus TaxID=1203425 RepID=UPI00148FD6E1|nr:chymotrypsin-like protease CTRL-1 [Notolabrus celidotus]